MEMPEDIKAITENCIPVGLKGNHYLSTLREYIRRALLAERERATQAERERCAKIAERATVDVKARGVDGVRAAPIPHRSEIAAAIRTPSTAPEET